VEESLTIITTIIINEIRTMPLYPSCFKKSLVIHTSIFNFLFFERNLPLFLEESNFTFESFIPCLEDDLPFL